MIEKARFEFIKNIPETTVPQIKLTRSFDTSTGTATFYFEKPDVFSLLDENTIIRNLTLKYKDYTCSTSTILIDSAYPALNLKFFGGQPRVIIASFAFTNENSWNLFMSFMNNYCLCNNLDLIL